MDAKRLRREIGRRIFLARVARELTRMELEHRADQAAGTVSRFEAGERAPNSLGAVLIATALDVDVGWLLTGKVPDGKWRPPLGTELVTKK